MLIDKQPSLTADVTDSDHIRGQRGAPVTIVEYGDYECPLSAAARPILAELVRTSRGRVRLVFRNFPLVDVHPRALPAALAAEAAAAHGEFWGMHELLFSHQDRLRDRDLIGYAELLGLTGTAVVGDAVRLLGDRIDADLGSGMDSGVRTTPALFVNGRRYTGRVDLTSLRPVVRRLTAVDGR